MKKYLIAVLMLLCINACAQKSIKITPVKSGELRSILASVDTVMFKNNLNAHAILYKVANAAGSAHMPETDEISHKFLIAVSSNDTAPEQNLYTIGDFYLPKIIQFVKIPNDHFRLIIEYVASNQRKRASFNISLKNALIE